MTSDDLMNLAHRYAIAYAFYNLDHTKKSQHDAAMREMECAVQSVFLELEKLRQDANTQLVDVGKPVRLTVDSTLRYMK